VIALIEGKVVERGTDRVVLLANGVGYEALVSSSTASQVPPVGKETRLFTRLQARDDSLVLYGFATADERALFDMLVKVTGVGPKLALAILSSLEPGVFRRAVAAGDLDAITVVPGVGKKVAARVVLDLRDKLGMEAELVTTGPLSEVREALLALGLSPQEARDAMSGLSSGNGQADRPVEDLLREALQSAGRS